MSEESDRCNRREHIDRLQKDINDLEHEEKRVDAKITSLKWEKKRIVKEREKKRELAAELAEEDASEVFELLEDATIDDHVDSGFQTEADTFREIEQDDDVGISPEEGEAGNGV
jgi:chromosome segregation ATPase